MKNDPINPDENAAVNGNGNGRNGERLPALRGPGGRFLPGTPAGPGNPLAAQATTLRNTWFEAAKSKITQAVAEELIGEALRIALKGKRERDRIAAIGLLTDKLGLSLQRIDEQKESTGDFIINVSFTPKVKPNPPPPGVERFIDEPPSGPDRGEPNPRQE